MFGKKTKTFEHCVNVEKVFGLDYSRSASLFSSQKGAQEGFTDSDRNRKVELGLIK